MKKILLVFVAILSVAMFSMAQDASQNESYAEKLITNGVNTSSVDFSGTKFQGYTYLGADFNSVSGGPSLDLSLGIRTLKYFYIGAGIGWHNLIETTTWNPCLSFTADFKFILPTQSGFNPRFDLSVGSVCVIHLADGSLLVPYTSFGLGFDYRRFSFAAGCQIFSNGVGWVDEGPFKGYFRIGIRLGK